MKEQNLGSAAAVHYWARTTRDTTAIVYESTRISYGTLSARVRSLAPALSDGGVRAGDRIAFLGRNGPVLLAAALAAAHLGAVFVPLNVRLAGSEVAYLLGDCRPHTLIAEDANRPLIDGIADTVSVQRFLLADSGPAAAEAHPRWEPLPMPEAVETAEPPETADAAPPVAVRPTDPAVIMYTSGTTGRPKGAVLTHGNLWWNHVNTAAVIRTRLGDPTLVLAPMFHIAGLSGFTLGSLCYGGTLVIRRSFSPEQCLEDLVEHRVANLIAVPTMFAAIAATAGFPRADLSALRAAIVGGAPVPPALVRDYLAHGIPLHQAWGMTETAPLAGHLPTELVAAHPDAAGFPLPHTEIRLVDPATGGVVTEPEVAAEICVRGPNVFAGYWNDPEATGRVLDDAGWFRSGDIGRFDKNGLLFIVDRLKDVIISGGENIYPAELERHLAEYPGVREAAVVGVEHPRWGESPVAVLCQDEDGRATLEEIRAFIGQRLARYKLPTAVHHADALPRNGSGKVDKAALRVQVLGGQRP
ncbi:AMP-binding protein [Streptomyces iranensis]|uniref:Fatty-acyl-CoA synthase n=1 Tax=Streptomyces iranensis TaxID=576784 RepID=A0A061A1D3_9ACTN|nr:AMP-binding protein [Streptomyces iranensis]MBP2068472.1 fatty-acyl-CoA synthase [Streptomyces iranensis]CDR15652.1 O-succinylbenzoate-CoA ligase [Streptomyces iranensis]